MSSVNPYAPPTARVADDSSVGEYQPIKVWSSDGRIGRLRYLAYGIVGYLILGLSAAFGGFVSALMQVPALAVIMTGIIVVAYFVFIILQTIKRCHDVNWTGWWTIMLFLPLANFVFGLLMLFVPGTRSANTFGPPPPPNRTALAVIVIAIGGAVVIGMLAAIAIPAYQDYVNRARAAQTR